MAAGDTLIRALLTLNVANFLSALQKADTATGQSKTKMEKLGDVGKGMTNVGNNLTRNVTLPIITIGTQAVKTAAQFEQEMSKVQALSGAVGSDFDRLSEKAREMGADTIYSASESAEAFGYMALAGWDTEQMLAAIEPILYLAGGGMMDLGRTSDIVTDNISAFGLTAEDTARFTDVLAETMRSSNTDVEQMGEAFKYVAPLAGSLGFSIEDVSFALGLMANSGTKGSAAGTALRGAITNLISPTDKMAGVMEQYGIQVTNSDGSMRTLREIMDNIRSSFANLTEEQRQAAEASFLQAGGADAAAAAMQGLSEEEINLQTQMLAGQDIIASWSEQQINAHAAAIMSKEELKELTDEQINAAVAADQGRIALEGLSEAEQAAASANLFGKYALSGMLSIVNASEKDYNNLAGAIDGAEGATQDLYDVSQDNLLGTLASLNSSWEELMITVGEKLIPVLIPLVEKLIEIIDWLADLDEGVIETALKIAGIVAVVGPVLSILGNLITVIAAIGTVVTSIGAPIALLIAGFALFVGGIIHLWNTNEDFRNAVIEIWNDIVEFLSTTIDAIIVFFSETIPNAINEMIEWFRALPGNIYNAIIKLIDRISEWANGVIEAFTTWITNIIDSVVSWFVEMPGKIATAIETFITETIPNFIDSALKAFGDGITFIIDFIIDLFTKVPFDIYFAIVGAIDKFKEWIAEMWDAAYTGITNWINDVIVWFSELPGKIYNAIIGAIDSIKNWAVNLYNTAKDAITNLINNIVDWFTELPGKIGAAIGKVVGTISAWGRDMMRQARDVVGNLVDNIVDWFRQLPRRVIDIGSNMIAGIWDGIQSMGGWLRDRVLRFCDNIIDNVLRFFGINSPSKLFSDEVGKWIPPGIAVGMEATADSVLPATEAISEQLNMGLNNGIQNTMSELAGNMQGAMSALSTATSGIGSTLFSATQELGSAAQNPIAQREQAPIYINEINVKSEEDLTKLSRALFDRNVDTMRALGRA